MNFHVVYVNLEGINRMNACKHYQIERGIHDIIKHMIPLQIAFVGQCQSYQTSAIKHLHISIECC